MILRMRFSNYSKRSSSEDQCPMFSVATANSSCIYMYRYLYNIIEIFITCSQATAIYIYIYFSSDNGGKVLPPPPKQKFCFYLPLFFLGHVHTRGWGKRGCFPIFLCPSTRGVSMHASLFGYFYLVSGIC